jgi:hypothetical protein
MLGDYVFSVSGSVGGQSMVYWVVVADADASDPAVVPLIAKVAIV